MDEEGNQKTAYESLEPTERVFINNYSFLIKN
jgi:hypothetical protein